MNIHIKRLRVWFVTVAVYLTMLGMVFMASGCAEFNAARTGVAVHGAEVADATRETAEWTLCQAITVGAWRRAYGADAGKASGWRALCASRINEVPSSTHNIPPAVSANP